MKKYIIFSNLIVTSTIMILVPYYINNELNADFHNHTGSEINKAINSIEYEISVIVSLTISLALLIEIVVNYFTSEPERTERLGGFYILVPNLIIADSLIYFVGIAKNSPQIIWLIINIKDFVNVSSLFLHLDIYGFYDKNNKWIYFLNMISMSSCFICRQFSLSFCDISTVLGMAKIFSMLIHICCSFFSYYKQSEYNNKNKNQLTSYDHDSLFYYQLMATGPIIAGLMNFMYFGVKIIDISTTLLCIHHCFVPFFVLNITIRNQRQNTHNRLTNVENIVKLKSIFVRYVNHKVLNK